MVKHYVTRTVNPCINLRTGRQIVPLALNHNMTNNTRKVAVLLENGHASVRAEPVPSPVDGEILVRVHASLLSPGTELSQARQHRRDGVTSDKVLRAFGYQNAGVVERVGADVKRFREGNRVACMGGGALHTDWCVVPQNLAVTLPDNVSFEQAAYCHLAATALHAIHRGKPQLGEHLLVVGAGVIGQLCAQFGQLAGAFVMLWDTLAGRLAIARGNGVTESVQVNGGDEPIRRAEAFTRGRGFDIAFVATGGDGSTLLQDVHNVMCLTSDGHREGRIVMVGGVIATTRWAAGFGNLDVLSSARTGPGYHDDVWEHGRTEYPYPWVRWSTRDNLELVIRLISEKRLNVQSLTTHRLPIEQIEQAISLHIDQPDSVLGTILLMNE